MSKASDNEILAEARERRAYHEAMDGDNRKCQLEDTKFVYIPGEQWDKEARKKNKMALQFNQLKQFVNQVVNDMRQGRPGVVVTPASGDASEKVAEITQDLIRGIERASDAESSYDTGFQHAVVGGRGYWRVFADYESPKSFNQCLKIGRLPDPLAVRMDPDFQKSDASDAAWCFVETPVKKRDYERLYKDAPLSWEPAAEDVKSWYVDPETVIVVDYYRIVSREREAALLSDGRNVWKDEWDELPRKEKAGVKIVKTRTSTDQLCEWYTLGGGEKVIKHNPWVGRYIPVVMCMGDEIIVDGKRVFQGLIRHAKEPQQLYNYGMTQQAFTLSLAPKAPFIGPAEAVREYSGLWEKANTEEFGYLPYHHKDAAGEPLPAPQRAQASFDDMGWANWSTQMLQQIRSTIGMYENSLGMRATESSGKAILAREKQGDNATFHYVDNLARAIAYTGRILEDLRPHYYDTRRLVSLVAQDGKQRMGEINGQVMQPGMDGAIQYMADPDSDMTRGEYAVSIQSGPSYLTAREQTRETLMALGQAYPPAVPLIGDKLAQVMDIPDAQDLGDRFKAMLPPQIQQMEAAKKDGKEAPDPAMLAQMQQMQQQMQMMGQQFQALQAENQQLKQGEMSKAADAQAKGQAEVAKANADADLARYKADLDAKTKLETTFVQVAGQIFAGQIQPPAQAHADEGGAVVDAVAQPAVLAPEQILAGVAEIAQALAAAFNQPKVVQLDNGRTATVTTQGMQ